MILDNYSACNTCEIDSKIDNYENFIKLKTLGMNI